jgi:hypothetical protein
MENLLEFYRKSGGSTKRRSLMQLSQKNHFLQKKAAILYKKM